MNATTHISRWGTSLAIRIPQGIAQQLGVQEGSAVEIIPGENQVVLRKRLFVLSDMLAEVTDDNLHAEQDAGPAQSNEGW